MPQYHHLRTEEELEKFCDLVRANWLKGKKPTVEFTTPLGTRTATQNNALHLWLQELADSLNAAGFEILSFPWKEGVDLPWDKQSCKERLWRPIQEAMKHKHSTTECDRTEYGDVYEALTRHLANILPGFVPPPWPSADEKR